MHIKIKNKLEVSDLDRHMVQIITDRLTIDNPKYQEAQRMGCYTHHIEPKLKFYEQVSDGLILPRGFAYDLVDLCHQHNEPFHFKDRRRVLPEVGFTFRGSLRDYQQKAVNAGLEHDFGVLEMPTGAPAVNVDICRVVLKLKAIMMQNQNYCFGTKSIGEYIGTDWRRIGALVKKDGLPAYKNDGKGGWRADKTDLDEYLLKQRDRYLNAEQATTKTEL